MNPLSSGLINGFTNDHIIQNHIHLPQAEATEQLGHSKLNDHVSTFVVLICKLVQAS